MSKPDERHDLTRRDFIRGAGLLGLGGAAGALMPENLAAQRPESRPAAVSGYDMDRLRKTDPKLVQYKQSHGIPVSLRDFKRIILAQDKRLYVTAGKGGAAYDLNGARLVEFATDREAAGMAVAGDGTLFVCAGDHVETFDAQGRRIAQWAGEGGKALFSSIAVGEKDVFVTDAGNRLVHRYDRTGKPLGRIGERDPERKVAGFVVPSPYFDLEIDGERIWVANPGNHQVESYGFDGQRVSAWGNPGFDMANFCGCCNPSFFTRMKDGRFVTSEKGINRIKIYSSRGDFESVVAGAEDFPKYAQNGGMSPMPLDIAADEAGRVYVADPMAGMIRVYTRKETA